MASDSFKGQADYQVPVLRILAGFPWGKATAAQIMAALQRRYGDHIPVEHRQPLSSNPKVEKWQTHVSFARLALIRRGLMDGSQRGLWTITQEGWQWVTLHPDAERIEPGTAPPPDRSKRRKRTGRAPKQRASTAPSGSLAQLVTFQLNGRTYRLSGEDVLRRVRQALAAGAPAAADDYRTWAVEIDGRRLNVRWVLELAVDQPRTSFNSPVARKLLRRLGIEPAAVQPATTVRKARPSPKPTNASPDAPDQTARHATLDREIAAIRNFLSGRADRPSDEKLCDWVYFCYTFGLYSEADRLFQVVNPAHVPDWYFARTKRVAQVCAQRARG